MKPANTGYFLDKNKVIIIMVRTNVITANNGIDKIIVIIPIFVQYCGQHFSINATHNIIIYYIYYLLLEPTLPSPRSDGIACSCSKVISFTLTFGTISSVACAIAWSAG